MNPSVKKNLYIIPLTNFKLQVMSNISPQTDYRNCVEKIVEWYFLLSSLTTDE